MHEVKFSLFLLLRSLLFEVKWSGQLAARLLVPMLRGIMGQPMTWFVLTMTAVLYLSFAPVGQKWSDRDTGRSFIALLVLYPIAELLARQVSLDVTSISIKRHLAWLAEMDDIVHEFNVIRALNQKELREFAGEQTLAEIQMRMADSQDRMVEIMGAAAAAAPAGEQDQAGDVPELDIPKLMNTVLLIIWGTQGGGKTTLAKMIARLREREGHTITVCDPHGSVREWGEWLVIGSGRNYKQIDQHLIRLDADITQDYQQYSTGGRNFPFQTLLVDEFTQWSDRCKNSASFVKTACSDLRKIKRCVILITHSDTITGLGDARGMRDAIDRSAVKLQLETRLNDSGEYVPTGYGFLQYPGQEPQRVKIPREQSLTLPPATAPAVDLPVDDRERLEQIYQQPVAVEHPAERRGELSDRQRSILEFASGKDKWFIPSDLQANLKTCRGIAADTLIADFYALERAGYGAVRVTKRSVQWRYFAPDNNKG